MQNIEQHTEDKGLQFLFLCLLIAYYFPLAAINLGFALKPCMLLVPLLAYYRPKLVLPFSTYEKCLLLFGLASSIAHLDAFNASASFRMLMGLAIFMVCYFAYRDHYIRLFSPNTFITFGLLYCLYNLTTYACSFLFLKKPPQIGVFFIGHLYDRGLYRMAGSVGSPNYLSLFIFPILFMAWEYRRIFPKWAWVLPLICIFLTFSLSSYLSLIIAVVMGLAIAKPKLKYSHLKRFRWFSLLLIIPLALVLLDYVTTGLLAPGINNRIHSLYTGSGRFHMWSYLLKFLYSENFLSGIGLNNLQLVTRYYFHIVNIHNTYLEVLVEQGILGFAAYVSFLITLGYVCYREFKKENGKKWPLLTLLASSVNIFFVSATITPDVLITYLLITAHLGQQKHESKKTPVTIHSQVEYMVKN